jgi:hypothetical protein
MTPAGSESRAVGGYMGAFEANDRFPTMEERSE